MKNIREMTDLQAIEIGKLALSDVTTQDWFTMALAGNRNVEYDYFVQREVYDREPEYLCIRIYIDGMPDCWATIWEEDFNVDVTEGSDYATTANMVTIVKKLIEWSFV